MPIIKNNRPAGRPDNLEDDARTAPSAVRPYLQRLADQLEQTLPVLMDALESPDRPSPLREAATEAQLPTGHGATVIDGQERAWSRNKGGSWVRVDIPSLGNMAEWAQVAPTLPATVLCEGVHG